MRILNKLTISLLLPMTLMCQGNKDERPINVSLCELYKNPIKYNHKLIRVRGGSISSLSIDDILHNKINKPCNSYLTIIVMYPSQLRHKPKFRLIKDSSLRKLTNALAERYPVHIDATYEGRFDVAFVWRKHHRIMLKPGKMKGYGKDHLYDARIVLHRVKNVWTMPLAQR